MQTLGMLTLNISFSIYLIWFIPQILLNFKRKSTAGLSLMMHCLLCSGYLCDLLYGFGREMQWQYRTVTLVGLVSLCIQHFQFGRYGFSTVTEKRNYIAFTVFYLIFSYYAVFSLTFDYMNKEFYTVAGMLAHICWLIYAVPQIIQNQFKKSTIGLSSAFIFLAICLNICDLTSAWTLGWAYPSKIGPAFSLFLNITMLLQIIRYSRFELQYRFNR